jgi:hypothetical protein
MSIHYTAVWERKYQNLNEFVENTAYMYKYYIILLLFIHGLLKLANILDLLVYRMILYLIQLHLKKTSIILKTLKELNSFLKRKDLKKDTVERIHEVNQLCFAGFKDIRKKNLDNVKLLKIYKSISVNTNLCIHLYDNLDCLYNNFDDICDVISENCGLVDNNI